MDPFIPTTPSPSYLDTALPAVGDFFQTIAQKGNQIITPHASFQTHSLLATPLLSFIIIVIIVILIIGVIYASLRMKELRTADRQKYHKYFIRPTPERRTNERWGKVEQLFHSANESDWRLGIMEADVMLDECVQLMGYQGDNLGERLKSAHVSNFPTLQLAWEAHKVRNAIAHQGLEYHLTAEEAWRAFKLFESVFRDTKFI